MHEVCKTTGSREFRQNVGESDKLDTYLSDQNRLTFVVVVAGGTKVLFQMTPWFDIIFSAR